MIDHRGPAAGLASARIVRRHLHPLSIRVRYHSLRRFRGNAVPRRNRHQHVELIDGIITEVSPQSPEHAAVVQRLGAYLAAYNAHGLLRVQAPLHVTAANSLPEPDLAVTAEPSDPREHPREAVLVIEVAVSTQALDRGRKQELYAATGIPTYWLVDVPARTVEVRTSPGDSGYDALTVYPDGASVSALSSGEDPLSLASLFVGL